MNVVITGATKGIGYAIAKKFVTQGANIAICARHIEELKTARQQLLAINSDVQIIISTTDLNDKEATKDFANQIKKEWQQVDVLINNAGAFLQGEMMKEKEDQLAYMLSVNVLSVHYLTRALLGLLKEKKGSQIFNICSVASKKPFMNSGSYSVSKFALLGYTNNLREELKDQCIKVTAVLPGATWSDSWAGVDIPKDRIMQAQEIAETIWSISQLGENAVVEEVVLRPQLGDL